MFRNKTALISSLLCLSSSSPALAQVFNPTITPGATPITVSTSDQQAMVRPTVQDQRLVNLAGGLTANAGNSKTYGGNLGGRFVLIKNSHQFTAEALGNMAGARSDNRFSHVTWTARNVIGRVRYDLFLTQWNALFVAMQPRRDKFAGLNLRLQNQVGYSRNLFFPVDAHRLWTEVGYDFTWDKFSAVEGAMSTSSTSSSPMQTLTNGATQTSRQDPYIHSARVFFGYTNRLTPTANLTMGMENLFDFRDAKNVRINGLVEFTSSITHTFKLGMQSRVMFDNVPVPGAKKYDAIAVAQLVYTFDSNGPAAPCPVCDCTAQVQAAQRACPAAPASAPVCKTPLEALPPPTPVPLPETAKITPIPQPVPEVVPSPPPLSVPTSQPLHEPQAVPDPAPEGGPPASPAPATSP